MHKVTLYIIDDDPNVVEALVALFKPNKRYRVRGYSQVAEVLADLEGHPPQVAICDRRLPELDGLELLRRLRQRQPRLRSILLTGQDFGPDIVAGLEEGLFQQYCAKPYDAQVLQDLVHQLAREAAKEEIVDG